MEIDPKDYKSTGEYYAAVRKVGSGVPLQMMHALDQVMKHYGFSFAEAFDYLVKKGAIILVDPEK